MKTTASRILIAIALASVCAAQTPEPTSPAETENKVIPEMSGYKSVTIHRVEPDGLRIIHEAGAAKIPIEKLTDEQRTEYGLTTEGATEYRRRIAANAAEAQARQQDAARAEPRQPATPRNEAPTYISADQVKATWVKSLKAPRSLDPNYSKIIKSYRDFIADIKAGNRDLDAQETAAAYNKALAVRAGNAEMANTFENELARISEAKAAAAALAQREAEARRQRLDFMRLESELQSIDRRLRNLDTTIRGW
jgi:hypothetical protein